METSPKTRALRYAAGALSALALAAGAWFAFRPEAAVVAGNFDLVAGNLPANAGSLRLTLNRAVDASKLPGSFRIVPDLPGTLSADGNSVVYSFAKAPAVGAEYQVSLSKSVVGKGGEWSYLVRITPAAMLSAVFPGSGAVLSDLSQPLVAVFNVPMAPLRSLDETDAAACPVKVSPAVAGRCRWTAPNVLEFQPDRGWDGAARYGVEIARAEGILYPFGAAESSFSTSRLDLSFPEGASFDPDSGVVLWSNYPLDEKSLAAAATVGGKPARVETLSGSTRAYAIFPEEGGYSFDAGYRVSVAAGKVAPKYGNLAWSGSFDREMRSSGLVSSLSSSRDVLSETGAAVDSRTVGNWFPGYDVSPRVAARNAFLELGLAREIPLEKIRVLDGSGAEVPSEKSYVKEPRAPISGEAAPENAPLVENRLRVRVQLPAELPYSAPLRLSVARGAVPGMAADSEVALRVADKPGVKSFSAKSATRACFSFDTPMDGDALGRTLSLSPAARIVSAGYDWGYSWDGSDSCGQGNYYVNWRLDPGVEYSVSLSGATDADGSPLPAWSAKYRAPSEVPDKDKYLYASWSRDLNVVPDSVPLVLGLQSMNAKTALVQVCETDFEGYRDFLRNRWQAEWKPKCSTAVDREVPLKNRNWSLATTKVDVEKDLLRRAASSPYLILRGSPAGKFGLGENGYRDGEREFAAMAVRSGLSVALESGADSQLLRVTDLSGKPVASADIRLFARAPGDYSGMSVVQLSHADAGLKKAKEPGVWTLSGSASVAYAEVRSGSAFGVLDASGDMASNYDFKYVSGADSSTRDYLYLYTDRPIYKPGDRVNFKGFLRAFTPRGYEKSPIATGSLVVEGPAGAPVYSGEAKVDRNSNVSGSFVLPSGSPLGNFAFRFDDGKGNSVQNNGQFSIERYVSPAFKLNAAVSSADAALGGKVSVSVAPEYYFGGAIGGADGEWTTLAQDYFFDAKDFSDWQFGEGSRYADCVYWDACSYGDSVVGQGTFATDADGRASFSRAYSGTGEAEKAYSTTVTVTDPATRRKVSQTVSAVVHATDGYAGLKVPYWTASGSELKGQGVILDWNAAPKPGARAKVSLVRHEWMETRKKGVDGSFYSEWADNAEKEAEVSGTARADGTFGFSFRPKSAGEYEVRASYAGANGQAFESSSRVWVDGSGDLSFRQPDNSVAEMQADQPRLKPGDVARFTLQSPVSTGSALFLVEKDDAILDWFVLPVTSRAVRAEVPVKPSYYPNFYVKALALGWDAGSPLPAYRRALSAVKVDTSDRKLSVAVATDKKTYLPGEKITATVYVTDADGKPVPGANGSLAVVDESVLALKGNPKKNPYAFFFDMKRYLGVQTYVSLANLVDKLEVKDTSDGEKGGAGDQLKGGTSKKRRGEFRDTAFWLSDFTTGADGTAKVVTSKLPDNLTTWDIEAVANVAEGNLVGVGGTAVSARQAAMVSENLPRFVSAGDSVTVAPAVANRSGKSREFKVTMDVSGATVDRAVRSVTVADGETVAVAFAVKVPSAAPSDSPRQLKFAISADGGEGARDSVERFVPVAEAGVPETVALAGVSTGTSVPARVNVPAGAAASLAVRWSATPLAGVPAAPSPEEYAQASAWWTPSVLRILATKRMYGALDVAYDLSKETAKVWGGPESGYVDMPLSLVLSDYAVSVRDHQMTSGGFSWSPSSVSRRSEDIGLTASVAEALAGLRDLKYAVDGDSLESAASWMSRVGDSGLRPGCAPADAEYCRLTPSERHALARGALAATGDGSAAYKAYKMIPAEKSAAPSGDRLATLARIAASGKILPDEKKAAAAEMASALADAVANGLVSNPRGAFMKSPYDRFGETSKFAYAAALAGKAQDPAYAPFLSNAFRWLVAERRGSAWLANDAWFPSAAAEYALATGASASGFTAEWFLDSEKVSSRHVAPADRLSSFSFALSGSALPAGERALSAQVSGGTGAVWYDAAMSYLVPAKDAAPRSEGLSVTTAFYDDASYRKVLALQARELREYLEGKLAWENRKYPKDAFEYLKPVTEGKVGQVLVARNRVAAGEDRDNVRFEGFAPAGAEVVNANLATEAPAVRSDSFAENGEVSGASSEPAGDAWRTGPAFVREEFRDDRYAGFGASLRPGVTQFSYRIRLTHAGIFSVKPSTAWEEASPEVFGRSAGSEFTVR